MGKHIEMNTTYFYQDKPIFGLDIGFSSIKVMQLNTQKKKVEVTGYGIARFDPSAIVDNIISNPESIAKSINDLFQNNLVGDITTRRVVVSVPAAHTFTRIVTLPQLNTKDLTEAIRLETEQYVPIPYEELYVDHTIIRKTEQGQEALVVAVPRKIVDSYVVLTELLGLEIVAVETTVSAATRLFVQSEATDIPTVLIDLGSTSSDITVYDNALVVTGTVPGGGDSFSNAIAKKLGVTAEEARVIKTKYGLGVSKKQDEITECMKPILDLLVKEIRRMIRYYEERSGTERKVGQIITMGGGANMPGLSDYMTNVLRLPVRVCDPWQHMYFSGLKPPNSAEESMYVTVSGLALTNPKEIFS